MREKINKITFIVPAVFMVIVLIIAFAIPTEFGNALNRILSFSTHNFGWFYAIGATFFVLILFYLAFGKAGNIKFGGKDAKPDMSFWKWFCIVVTSGMAAGCCYYGVAEPLDFFLNPPAFSGAEGGSIQAAEQSLRYVFLHWGLHPYAIYTIPSIAIAFMYWNGKRRFSICSGLYPFIGEKVDGKASDWVNALCIFGYVAGVSTAIGLASDQIATGFQYVTGLEFNRNILYIVVILFFLIPSVVSSCSGLHKGIAFISTTNMYIYIFLIIAALIFSGNVVFLINNTVSSVGQYFQFLPGQSLYLEPAYQSGWVNGWTIFYWAWWVSVCPLVGLFQVKMAKGRTVRQFILVNMFAPCVFIVFWFGFFGSSAINMCLNGNTTIPEAYAKYGSSIPFFAWLKELPFSGILIAAGFLAILFSLVTMLESQILNISDLCTKGVELDDTSSDATKKSPVFLKVFWGCVMCLMGFALLYSNGGITAVQTTSLVLGLPIMGFTMILAFAALKIAKNYKKYDKTLKPGEDYER